MRVLLSSCLTALAALTGLVGCSGGVAPIPGESSSGGSSSGTSGTSSGTVGPGPSTAPTAAWNGRVSGCGDVFTFRASDDGTQYVTVQIDRAKIGMQRAEKRSFDLAKSPAGIRVGVEIFARAPKDPSYCNDVVTERIASTVWTAEAGTLDVELVENTSGSSGGSSGTNDTFRATVRLEGLRLVGPERGSSVLVPTVEMRNVVVGWFAG